MFPCLTFGDKYSTIQFCVCSTPVGTLCTWYNNIIFIAEILVSFDKGCQRNIDMISFRKHATFSGRKSGTCFAPCSHIGIHNMHVSLVSRVSAHGHLNITHDFGPHGRLPWIKIPYVCIEVATVAPWNAVHGHLPGHYGMYFDILLHTCTQPYRIPPMVLLVLISLSRCSLTFSLSSLPPSYHCWCPEAATSRPTGQSEE